MLGVGRERERERERERGGGGERLTTLDVQYMDIRRGDITSQPFERGEEDGEKDPLRVREELKGRNEKDRGHSRISVEIKPNRT